MERMGAVLGISKLRSWKLAMGLSLVLMAVAVSPSLSQAHHSAASGEDGYGRVPGLPDFQQIGKTTMRYDEERRAYFVRLRPGQPELYTHPDPPTASASASSETALPSNEDSPHCVYSGHRIIPVWSHRPGSGSYTVARDAIRSIVRRMNTKIRNEALRTSGGTRELQMVVECEGSALIRVRDVASWGDAHQEIAAAVTAALGSPEGASSVKYLVFREGGDPDGAAGWGFGFNGVSEYSGDWIKSSSDVPGVGNRNRTYTTAGIVYGNPQGTQYDYWRRHTSIHEMMHTFGAVQYPLTAPKPAHPTEGAHCTDGLDIMCYSDSATGPVYEEWYCPASLGFGTPDGLPLDCGGDTYFDAGPEAGEWLYNYWNTGGSENPFLSEWAPTPATISGVGVTSHVEDDLDLFARSGESSLWRKRYTPAAPASGWSGWFAEQIPNGTVPIAGSPAVAARSATNRDLFVRGTDNQLYYRNWENGVWSSWFWIQGPGPTHIPISGSPAVTWRSDTGNAFTVVVRGSDNQIYGKSFAESTGWTSWFWLGAPPGGATSSPAVAMHANTAMHIVVRGSNGQIWDRSWSPAGWSEWISLGGNVTSSPALAGAGGNIWLFARGTDNTLQYRRGTYGWTAWASLGGSVVSDPAAATRDSGGVDVLAVLSDGRLWQRRFVAGSWTGWFKSP